MLFSHNQVRGHRTGSSHSGAEERPTKGKTQTQPRWYTHISQPTQFMPDPETYNKKSEIGSQSTMCQVSAWCIRLITRAWKNRLYIPLATQERPPRIYYTKYLSLRIRTTDASQLEKRNKGRIRRERKGKKREEGEKENEKKGKERKEETRRKARRKGKTRRGSKERKGKKKNENKKNVMLADPRN